MKQQLCKFEILQFI